MTIPVRFFALLLILVGATAVLTLIPLTAMPATTPSPSPAMTDFAVESVQPAPRSINAETDTAITLQFDQPVSPTTFISPTVRVFGRWSGPKDGTFGFANLDHTVIFTPNTPFSAGEQVMVILSRGIQASDGTPLPTGYAFQFWTRTQPATLQFEQVDTLSVRTTPGQPTQAYGGVATDFNRDGWLDISIINEVSADVRVFLNKADGTSRYYPFLQPTNPVNTQASPNEAGDFNLDGKADLAVANISTASISVLLGHGDGTFEPQQEITVGPQPRGITVLDVDSDGDPDIVNTNSGGAGNLSILLNNGAGVFGPPTFFEGGGATEYALVTADMNEDGRLDLVIGTRQSSNPQIIIQTGNGDGTFSFASAQSVGGRPWMINAADVNGDGHDDVATANSDNSTGSILLGDGTGHLAAPMVASTDLFTLATDLGDLDGDGDLDWMTSSYAGDWQLFLNDGQGNFTLYHVFPPTSAASCALLLDMDNDGVLDLGLIDEVADEVQLFHQPPLPLTPTMVITPTFISDTLAVGSLVTHTVTIGNLGGLALDWAVRETSCTAPANVSWLATTPLSGTTLYGTPASVAVGFDSAGLAVGRYSAMLCVASNDPSTPEWSLPLTLTVTEEPPAEPVLDVSPVALSALLLPGTAVTQSLALSNAGTAPLNWNLAETACAFPEDVAWLSALPISGTTAVSTTTPVTVTLDAISLLPGNYNADLCIASNDPFVPEWVVPVSLTVTALPQPVLVVSPTVLSATLAAGTAVTQSLSLHNEGTANLAWTVNETACTVPQEVAWLSVSPSSGTTAVYSATAVSVTFDTAGLAPGGYSANLCIASNDPATPEQTVTAALTVEQTRWWVFLPIGQRP